MPRRIKEKISRNPFLSQVVTLFSGSLAAQLIMVVLTIILLRRFTPEDMGFFGIYTALTGIPLAIACLRYDMAVMLPKEDSEAKQIVLLSARILLGMSVLTSALFTVFARPIADHYQAPHLIGWMPYTGLTVFLYGAIVLLTYWYNRRQEYRPIAENRVIQPSSTALSQIGMSYASGVSPTSGLIFGTLIGQSISLAALCVKARSFCDTRIVGSFSYIGLMKKYRRMPIFNAPNALIDSLRDQGMLLLIGTIAISEAGHYSTAQRLIAIPIALINGSLTPIFFQRFTDVPRGQMTPFILQAVKRAVMIGALPFTLMGVLSPALFAVVLGEQWEPSGHIVRILLPWLFVSLITGPLISLFTVANRQGIYLLFSAVYTLIPLLILWVNPFTFMNTLILVSAVMAVMQVVLILLVIQVAKEYDRGATAPRS